MRALNLAGKRFGLLTALHSPFSKKGRRMWFCACDCGDHCFAQSDSLVSGKIKSCGCIRHIRKRNPRTHHPLYDTWCGMRRRCACVTHADFHHYGGRGIRVCARWSRSFWAFVKDMGPRPEGMTLDRIDVNGNYEPGNCRWADWSTQQKNRRPYKKKMSEGATNERFKRKPGSAGGAGNHQCA